MSLPTDRPVPSIWSSPEYALDWPRELLRDELLALLQMRFRNWYPPVFELLLREAFHETTPAEDFQQWIDRFDPDDAQYAPGEDWLDALADNLDALRRYTPPAPLWITRKLDPASETADPADPREAFADLVLDLQAKGYFARRFPGDCHDDDVDEHGERPHQHGTVDERITRHLAQVTRSGTSVWPPQRWHEWTTDTFYELIEALHDVVARPRQRWYHEDRECGWHFENPDVGAGRRVYRALVNRLLRDRSVGLELSDTGAGEGRLMTLIDDGRTELLDRVRPDPTQPDTAAARVGQRVDHAIALFRGRGASEHDKRSAVLALAGVLEERRDLIRDELSRKDEGALFRLANEFALRHQNSSQQGDYDPAFLDWIFWWYLATVELTNTILDRQHATAGPHEHGDQDGAESRP